MSESSGKNDPKIMGRWVCYGVAIGCAIGLAIGNLTLGIGPGGAIGLLIGTKSLKSKG